MVAIALRRASVGDAVELAKPRIVLLVMLTVAAGFWLGAAAVPSTLVLFHLMLGTALVAAGTNALNQVAERDVDALMLRTRMRPLPAGRMDVSTAMVGAWMVGIGGVAYLLLLVNLLTAVLAAATLATYVFLYTPLKRRSSVATLVGAIPGALPIVGGWTAAGGSLGPESWVLFWILFLWQLPHFLALGWLYKDDYARAELKTLSLNDPDGRITFSYATLYAAALLPASLMPAMLGTAGTAYFVGAVLLSGLFLAVSFRAARNATALNARRLFRASLAYLPILLLLMVVNKLP
ncbi:MAG: heme o synthase [Gemmatimonadales bacterium]